eukprot:gene20363-22372_t
MEPVQPVYNEQPAIRDEFATQTMMFGPTSQPFQCPACGQQGSSVTQYEAGKATWLAAALICPFCPVGCCLLPFVFDNFKDVQHTCPKCNTILGKWEKL